ncbi:MAG: hypothetical protein HY718_08960 [Planctomycetes bacterium]|nr:hypothetical protein [Planctomycetota bacterium]
MRLVYKLYADGTHSLVSTDDRGENPRVLEGQVPPRGKVTRIPAYIEVSCDQGAETIEQVRNALTIINGRLATQ